MNIGWIKIIIAAFFELGWITGLKYAHLPWEWVLTILSLTCSSYCLITAGETLPVGTAYSVFVGMSALGTILIEFLCFHTVLSSVKLLLISCLLIGIIGLKLVTDNNDA